MQEGEYSIQQVEQSRSKIRLFSRIFPSCVGQAPKNKRHTFAKCKECALTYKNAQQTFPGVKFTPGKSLAECASVLVEQNKASKSEQTSTKEILLELDTLYQATYGHSFTQSLVECKTAGIQNKPTAVERKRAKRTLHLHLTTCNGIKKICCLHYKIGRKGKLSIGLL